MILLKLENMLKSKLGTRKNSIVLGGKGSCNRKVKLEI